MLNRIEKKDENGDTIICTVDENGVRQGPYEAHYRYGLIGKGNYKDGKKDGPYEVYSKDGKLLERQNFKDGEIDGVYERYFKNGQLEVKATFEHGQPIGLYECYYANGQLHTRCTYEPRGIKEGLDVSYHGNGKLSQKHSYRAGQLDGPGEVFNEKGELESRTVYSLGRRLDGEEAENYLKEWEAKQKKAEEARREEKEEQEEYGKRREAIGNLKGRLEMLSDPEFRKPIGKARTSERQAKAEEITEVRRAKAMLSRAAQKAVAEGDTELLKAIEEVARPYALHSRRIQREFQQKRMERRSKKDRG